MQIEEILRIVCWNFRICCTTWGETAVWDHFGRNSSFWELLGSDLHIFELLSSPVLSF